MMYDNVFSGSGVLEPQSMPKDTIIDIGEEKSDESLQNNDMDSSDLTNSNTLGSFESGCECDTQLLYCDLDSDNNADDEYSTDGYDDFKDSSDEEYMDREKEQLEKEKVRDEEPFSKEGPEPVMAFVPLLLKMRNYVSVFSSDGAYYSTDDHDEFDEQGRAKYDPTPDEWERMKEMEAASLRDLPPKEPFKGDWAEKWNPEEQPPVVHPIYTEEQLKALRTFPAKARSKHYRPSPWATSHDVVEKKPKPNGFQRDL